MEISRAKREDLSELMSFAKSVYHYDVPLDEYTLELQLRNLLINRNANMFIAKENNEIQGMVAGIIASWPYNLNISVAQEYIAEGYFLEELREAFQSWAKLNGVTRIIKLCISNELGPRVKEIK